MKTLRTSPAKRGFTLMELMVAMAITTIIVTVLVSITSLALDTWNRSRNELRAARQGKTMIDSMARDFESLVTRPGNANEWLSATTANTSLPKVNNTESGNTCDLIFFTAATDRYNGQIGTATDMGGDVSCVSYGLSAKDPITQANGKFETFVLSRMLVNPDKTFTDLLGKADLASALSGTPYGNNLSNPENFVCENIYQFSLTFHVQVAKSTTAGATTTTVLVDVPVTVGKTTSGEVSKEFRIQGSGLIADVSGGIATPDELKAGRLTAVEIAITVISDFGIDQLRTRTFSATQQAEFLAKNSYQYTKLVQVPGM